MTLYPSDQLYREMTFLAYYLHWSRDDLMRLPHQERRRWCQEVSGVNQKLNGDEGKEIPLR